MPTSITRFAPQLIVLTVAAYWGWSALGDFLPKGSAAISSGNKNVAASKEFAATALSPKFSPLATRDPFTTPGARAKKIAKGHKPGQKPALETLAIADGASLGLTLSATCILGDRKFAMINGQVYREKETVQTAGSEPMSCVVTSILPREVVLSWQGKLLRLDYPDAPVKADAAKVATKATQ
jgi:hypothetical protein